MKILAIDLGTNTGIAHNFTGEVQAKTLKLATAKEVSIWGKSRLTRRNDPRITRFAEELNKYREADVVVWEDVLFSTYTKQNQLWSSLRAAIWLTFKGFSAKQTILECVPVTSLKVFATGAGNATKEMMSKSLRLRFPDLWKPCYSSEDDSVDALWLYVWAATNLSRVCLTKSAVAI